MAGKPYLNIEVDEHSSDVGVITRVEAFVNSLRQAPVKTAGPVAAYARNVVHEKVNIKTSLADLDQEAELYLPHLFPYAHIGRQMLAGRGRQVAVLPATDRTAIDLGRKQTLTNEYFSLTALLGDVIKQLNGSGGGWKAPAFLVPQTEGAEVDGQYGRLLRTILDEKGHEDTDILSPFVEDALLHDSATVAAIRLGLLAGDLVLASPADRRAGRLAEVTALIEGRRLDLATLREMAAAVRDELKHAAFKKTVLALGEPYILYNDFLNDQTFRRLEARGHRVVYGPLSEYLWLLWRDFAGLNLAGEDRGAWSALANLEAGIRAVAESLAQFSPFAARLEDLAGLADRTVGLYAGTNGRYRLAKPLARPAAFDGVISVASTYENTGIALGILQRGLENGKPALSMIFDGNQNENDQAKIDSFIHYL